MINPEDIGKTATIYGHFYSIKGDLITNQLKEYSAHTRNELAMLKSLIREGDNIIDLGAHIGTFSIPFARFNKGKGKIFSFEADTDNYYLLELNISENHLSDVIMPMRAVVSDKKDSFTRFNPCNNNSGMYCFLPVCHPLAMDSDVLETAVVHIDEWYTYNRYGIPIDVIKIDVEGAEMAALRSCKGIIEQYTPLLYIEINKSALDRFNCEIDEIESLLKPFGYHFFRNGGHRNSDNDAFKIIHMDRVTDGGIFFDLLAVHPLDKRYPVV
jgi:FkbM family methyltransferase